MVRKTRSFINYLFVKWIGLLLPPANEVWGKVIFLHQFVILFTGGRAWLLRGGVHGFIQGGHVWFYLGGCAWFYAGGMRGFIRGACVVLFGGACMVLFGGVCVVLFRGSMRGFIQGACVVLFRGGHACFFQFFRIQWDTVNERAVRILLECILVDNWFLHLEEISLINRGVIIKTVVVITNVETTNHHNS